MLLEEIVIGSVKKDFLALLDGIEEKDRDYLYGCALVTDKDFASIHLIANTVNRHERKSDKTEINLANYFRLEVSFANWKLVLQSTFFSLYDVFESKYMHTLLSFFNFDIINLTLWTFYDFL